MGHVELLWVMAFDFPNPFIKAISSSHSFTSFSINDYHSSVLQRFVLISILYLSEQKVHREFVHIIHDVDKIWWEMLRLASI